MESVGCVEAWRDAPDQQALGEPVRLEDLTHPTWLVRRGHALEEISMAKSAPVLFDLDGVIIDNCRFEQRVTSFIISELASKRGWTLNQAETAWKASLSENRDAPRWHDYAFHCENLGLGNVWQTAHIASRRFLSPVPNIEKALAVASHCGGCWIASDATLWVIHFKLQAVGIDANTFVETFSLDRCGLSKTRDEYWLAVRDCLTPKTDFCVYVDNRLDLLAKASAIIERIRLIWLPTPDHPDSLGFVRQAARAALDKVDQVSPTTLADAVAAALYL